MMTQFTYTSTHRFLPFGLIQIFLNAMELSLYSVGPLAGWPRNRGSIHDRNRIFLFSTASRSTLAPTQPPIQWVPEALSLGVKRPGREVDHSPPSSAEVMHT
jgi:hypothetical protein